MFFPARRHNELAARAAAMYPIRVAEEQAPGRAHPWQIRPQWVELKTHPAGGYWTATVNPGLVNGQPAAITMPFSSTPPAVQERLKAEARAAKKPQPSGEQRVKVFLDEQASVELRWRAIGADAAPEGSAAGNADTGEVRASFEPVPEIFRIRGEADANPDLLGPQAETERYLREGIQLPVYGELLHLATGIEPLSYVIDVVKKPTVRSRKGEAPVEYAKRMLEDYRSRPEHFFRRAEVSYRPSHRRWAMEIVWRSAAHAREVLRGGGLAVCGWSCCKRGDGWCGYKSLCWYGETDAMQLPPDMEV
jgi:hypothetical protein